MGWDSSDVVRFDLRSNLQGQMTITKLKNGCYLFIIVPRVFGCEKDLSWAVNVLMWSDLTFEPFRIFLIIAVIFKNAVFLQYHVVLLRWVHLAYFTVVSFYIVCI